MLENDLAKAAPLASCFLYPDNCKNYLSGEIFHICISQKTKKSVLLFLKTAGESLLGGFRVRVLQVGILKGMETLKNGIVKGVVIIARVVKQKNADGIRVSTSFSSKSLQKKSHLQVTVFDLFS